VTIVVHMRVSGLQRLTRLANRLREAADGGLQRDLTAALVQESPAALAATRSAWAGVEVTSSRGGGSSSGLRGRVAAATSVRPAARGVHFEVNPDGVDPAYGRTLSWGLDGLGRWRHPVFGNRHAWETQVGQEVFFKTLRGREPQWRAGLERACERTARRIEG